MKVNIEIIQERIVQDYEVEIPDDVIKSGKSQCVDWLYKNGHVDNALDYSEVNTKISIYE